MLHQAKTVMRTHFLLFLFSAILLTGISCKKNTDTASVTTDTGIGFSIKDNGKAEFILKNVDGKQEISDFVQIKNYSSRPAQNEIHVRLQDKTTELVSAYNSANGTNVIALPSTAWTFPELFTLRANESVTALPISVTGATGLRTNKTYAVGLRIESADGNMTLSRSSSDLILLLRVTNADYTGQYLMKGQFYHPGLEPAFAPHSTIIQLRDTFHVPGRVSVFWPYSGGFYTPVFENGGQPHCCFADHHLALRIDPVSNSVICTWDEWIGNEDTYYEQLPAYNSNTYSNRYNPATATFYLAFGYSFGPGNTFVPSCRAWIDTLTYLGPL